MARSLLDLGWSPVAVVAIRMGGAFLVLLVPCLVLLRRTRRPTPRQSARVVGYGITAVAMAQLCFFSAVQYLPVGVALLLEYLAPVLLIGYHWLRNRRRPAYPVLIGAAIALIGLVFVLDLRGGLTLNPIGVLWGLGAAVGLASYFVLADDTGDDSVHPLLLTTGGTGVGALVVLAVAATGFLPMTARTGTATLAGAEVAWWLPLLLLVTVCAVFAYLDRHHRRTEARQLGRVLRLAVGGHLRGGLRGHPADPAAVRVPAARRTVDPGRHRGGPARVRHLLRAEASHQQHVRPPRTCRVRPVLLRA